MPAASLFDFAVAATSSPIASSTSSVASSTSRPRSKGWNTIRTEALSSRLLKYVDGEQAYIIAPQRLVVGDEVVAGVHVDVKPGNAMPLSSIPVGTMVHNVELKIGKGGALARSAGTYAQIVARDESYVNLRLRSGEQRLVHGECFATVGAVSNPNHMNISLGKAGRNRWLGRMPHNRGVSMNPVDHPHGGGEGKTSGGRHPVTPWGKGTKGTKTRRNKSTDKFVVSSRHSHKKKG
jgi:large subunit ribosomal protein L2